MPSGSLQANFPTEIILSPPLFPGESEDSRVVADPFLVVSNAETNDFDCYVLCEVEYESNRKTIGALGWRIDQDEPQWLGDVLDNSDSSLGHSFPHVLQHDGKIYLIPETTPSPLANSTGPIFWVTSRSEFPFGWKRCGQLWTRGSRHTGRITDLVILWVPGERRFLVLYGSGETLKNRLNAGWLDFLGGTLDPIDIAPPHEFPWPSFRSWLYHYTYVVWKLSVHKLPNLGQNQIIVAILKRLMEPRQTLPTRPGGITIERAPGVFRVLLQGQDCSRSWDIRESYGCNVQEFELRLEPKNSNIASLRLIEMKAKGSGITNSFDEFKVHTFSRLSTNKYDYEATDGFGTLCNGKTGWSIRLKRTLRNPHSR
jgi:hypothetical protein